MRFSIVSPGIIDTEIKCRECGALRLYRLDKDCVGQLIASDCIHRATVFELESAYIAARQFALNNQAESVECQTSNLNA